MERHFSLGMIRATLKDPAISIEELPTIIPEFFEEMGLRTTDTVAVKVPGLDSRLRFDHKGEPTAEFPTLMEMGVSLAKAAGRTVGAVVQGKKATVPDEVFEQRQVACRGCEHWNAERKRCKLCGCKTNYKLRLAREKCPDPERPRWLAWTPEKS